MTLFWLAVLQAAAAICAYDFEAYKSEFDKSYGPEENLWRRRLFESKVEEVRRHNSKNGKFRMGINEFSDRHPGEYTNGYAAGWRSDDRTRRVFAKVETPPSFDWRDVGIVTPVKNQGKCGSCWAHGSAESIESYVALSTGAPPPILSVQELVSCATNPYDCGGTGGCSGSIPELAFAYAQLYGISLNQTIPYLGANGTCSDRIPFASISGYVKLPPNDYESVMAALVEVGPLAINVDASKWRDYESGVFDACSSSKVDLNHIVQLVGYGHDELLNASYWTVRNSWGEEYGEDGYIRLLREPDPSKRKCASDNTPLDGTGCKGDGNPTQFVCGECGLLFDVSYPVGAHLVDPPPQSHQAPS